MRRVHFFSGFIVTLFIVFHLLNHTASIFGSARHIEIMTYLRQFYRNPIGEFVLLTAVSLQIISGLRLFKVNRKNAVSNVDKLQLWSGLYLAIFFIIHISAILVGRALLNLDTNFYFGAAGLNSFPVNLFFIPYYSLAILSFFGHLASIHAKKMRKRLLGLTPMSQAKVILIAGFLLVFVILYGLTNGFNGVAIPSEYDVLIGK